MFKNIFLCLSLICLFACSSSHTKKLKVAASATPHAEILATIKPDLAEQGVDLEIIVIDDYNIPNRSLSEKEIDANYFQHEQFLNNQISQFNYCLVPFAKIHIEPLGLYSRKLSSLSDLSDNSKVAIPNDPTNEARALQLLEREGLITLDPTAKEKATILSIKSNPKHLKFLEIDAALLPRTLDEVAIAAIPTNFALQANLSPEKNALAKEDAHSPYVNVLVIRCGDESREDLIKLKAALTSEKVRDFILQHYHGAIIPAF